MCVTICKLGWLIIFFFKCNLVWFTNDSIIFFLYIVLSKIDWIYLEMHEIYWFFESLFYNWVECYSIVSIDYTYFPEMILVSYLVRELSSAQIPFEHTHRVPIPIALPNPVLIPDPNSYERFNHHIPEFILVSVFRVTKKMLLPKKKKKQTGN